jgi:TDG/mug DNA glycosylase family protein
MTSPREQLVKRSFAPVVDGDTKVLILGSLPGEASLAKSQYYANPRNQFWRLIEAVTGAALPLPYDERLARLGDLSIGLWDVVKSATRTSSLDAAIKQHEANPLEDLVHNLPSLKAIGFNGGKASLIGRRSLEPRAGLVLVDLPSSSPAYTLSLERKAAAWRQLQPFLLM